MTSKPLLDLMLERDVQWPDGAMCAVQGSSGTILFTKSGRQRIGRSSGSWIDSAGEWLHGLSVSGLPVAADDCIAIITREVYEEQKGIKLAIEEVVNDLESRQTPTDQILHDRGTTYGSFNDNARVSQEIKASITSGAGYDALSDRHKEALEFIAGKIARIVNGGNPDYADNWDDISGYALLGKEDEKCTP